MLREKDIEQYLVKRVKEAGGKAYKWVSPGNTGVPDRIIFLPEGFIAFAELKAPGKKPSPEQIIQLERLRELGNIVGVVDSRADVDMLIALYKEYITLQEADDATASARVPEVLH